MQLKNPTQLLKFGSSGKPGFRFFCLSQDLTSLTWQSTKKSAANTKVDLKDIKEIVFGQRTEKFRRNNRPDLENLSFSIIYVDAKISSQSESLDLVCKDEAEFQLWTTALEALTQGKIDTHKLELARMSSFLQPVVTENKLTRKAGKHAFMGANDVYAFGWGEWGQNGTGPNDAFSVNATPKLLEHLLGQGVSYVACGWSHTTCLLDDGQVVQYGNRTGTGLVEDFFLPTITRMPERTTIVSLACGAFHSMALTDLGQVLSWGCNVHGQLGHGNFTDVSEPTFIEAFDTVPTVSGDSEVQGTCISSISCGAYFSAAVADDGRLFTWGCGDHGSLGNNDTKDQPVPSIVHDLAGIQIVRMACGDNHMIASTKSDTYSWGWNGCGQLGLDHEEEEHRPHEIQVLKGCEVKDLCCGAAHSVAIVFVPRANETHVMTWGNNTNGQLGQGKKKRLVRPMMIPELRSKHVVEVKAGAFHTLVRTEKGEVYSSGSNKYGQLGQGHTGDQVEFRPLEALQGKHGRLLSCGGQHSAILTARNMLDDSEAKECMSCKGIFTFVNRRHHCRNCGGIFCNTCSNKKAAILKYGFTEPVRVCTSCYVKLGAR